ncbi:hypothetical protein EEL52_11165 [Muribaculaceae bacterium Isolate-113 (HZI)]|nr:hypothetical protein EEL53_11790 [Muribaculaceae bacterium Isolate-114 (HZI)]ROT20110.1 hypothetical protein EEL52_11165 [Muribaculaceae bacterium Isolate-113 (HZI)]GFI39019.1 hypothetical protein IMSAGC016_00792 [Muribaculaceae bacterium]
MLLLNFVSAFLSLSTFAYPRQTEILEEIGEDFGFNLEQMRFIPNWNVYGFLLPTNDYEKIGECYLKVQLK